MAETITIPNSDADELIEVHLPATDRLGNSRSVTYYTLFSMNQLPALRDQLDEILGDREDYKALEDRPPASHHEAGQRPPGWSGRKTRACTCVESCRWLQGSVLGVLWHCRLDAEKLEREPSDNDRIFALLHGLHKRVYHLEIRGPDSKGGAKIDSLDQRLKALELHRRGLTDGEVEAAMQAEYRRSCAHLPADAEALAALVDAAVERALGPYQEALDERMADFELLCATCGHGKSFHIEGSGCFHNPEGDCRCEGFSLQPAEARP